MPEHFVSFALVRLDKNHLSARALRFLREFRDIRFGLACSGNLPAPWFGATVANDPCSPVPDTDIPAGLVPHSHAVHHVVGRIKHTSQAHLPLASGCEKHPKPRNDPRSAGRADPGLKLTPIAGLTALGGAGLAGLMLGAGGTTRKSGPHGHAKTVTVVPEPSSMVLLLSALVIAMAVRRLRGNAHRA